MALLNYTTKVPIAKTLAEIEHAIARNPRVGGLSKTYGPGTNGTDRVPLAVEFTININGNAHMFRLPARADRVLAVLMADRAVPKHLKSEDQALRVAWRILKDWVEAQMAIIEAGLVDIEEVFMPYAVVGDGTQTLYEHFRFDRLLTAPPPEAKGNTNGGGE